ncbi:MAG: type IV pilin protein [Candidatus Hadarchaeum sp.]
MHTRWSGFTLIELLVVVAIVAILAAVAIPSYLNYVRESRRSDAHSALLKVQLDQEKYRSGCTQYAGTLVGGTMSDCSGLGWANNNTPDGYYTIRLSDESTTGYTATATAVTGSSQASDTGCTSIVLTMSNGNTTTTPAACWKK